MRLCGCSIYLRWKSADVKQNGLDSLEYFHTSNERSFISEWLNSLLLYVFVLILQYLFYKCLSFFTRLHRGNFGIFFILLMLMLLPYRQRCLFIMRTVLLLFPQQFLLIFHLRYYCCYCYHLVCWCFSFCEANIASRSKHRPLSY